MGSSAVSYQKQFGSTRIQSSEEQSARHFSDVEKYGQIILAAIEYGAGSDGRITKTKLAKLVYLSDFIWYYIHLKPMSGATYRRLP